MNIFSAIFRFITQWALLWVDGVKYGLRLFLAWYRAFDRVGFLLVGIFLSFWTWVGFSVSRMALYLWPQIVSFVNTGSFSAGQQIPGVLAQGLAFANSFFPLTELCIFFVLFIPFYVSCVIFRMCKSWVPTAN